MAKKNKSNKKQKPQKPKSLFSQALAKKIGISSLFIALIVGSFYLYTQTQKPEYDLSVIGNGKPTVVQVHDPNCQLCRRLRSNLNAVKGDFTDKIQFKTANIASKKGQRFASQYQVPHVTLVFFDKRGKRVDLLQGVTPKEEIKTALTSLSRRR